MPAFPPHHSVPSIPVSQDIALKLLSTYLEKANTSPYLSPNAKLEPSGPTAAPGTSSVTIHNLQRIEAGLKGEWLAPTLELEDEPVGAYTNDVEAPGKSVGKAEAEEWQDLNEYQREQSVDEGDMGPRQAGFVQEGTPPADSTDTKKQTEREPEAPKAKKVKTKHNPDVGSTDAKKTPKDKEARKREKAARNDKLKKEKEQKRKEAAAQPKETAEE